MLDRDIEEVIRRMRNLRPTAEINQLTVSHPGADDDGVWFVTDPRSPFEVQLESTNGMCPFLIETDETDQRWTASSVSEAVEILCSLLNLSGTRK